MSQIKDFWKGWNKHQGLISLEIALSLEGLVLKKSLERPSDNYLRTHNIQNSFQFCIFFLQFFHLELGVGAAKKLEIPFLFF